MSRPPDPEQWHVVSTSRCDLDVREIGTGTPGAAPVVVIGTALTADELLPLATTRPFAGRRRIVATRRRGYGASAAGSGPGADASVASDAADVVALLDALGLEGAALVGGSYSAAVALQAAADFPLRVERVVAIEPPPVQALSGTRFRTANAELVAEYEAVGAARAADLFLRRLLDRHWRLDLDRILPGTSAGVDRDAEAFFSADLPALMGWTFDASDAARIAAPVLLVSGSETVAWFSEEIDTLHSWMRHSSRAVISGADHSVAWTHPRVLAELIDGFLSGVW